MKYWVGGAMWGGTEDVLPTFLKRGYWYCWGAEEDEEDSSSAGNSVKVQRERFRQIQPGDRIAVKKLLGRGSTEIEVRAVGIVRDIDENEWRAYVDWLPLGEIKRRVALHGCTASLHGPFDGDNPWVRQVFSA